MTVSTPDLYDNHTEWVRVVAPSLRHYGGNQAFCGPVATVKCGDDNSRVAEMVATEGAGRVLVVDGDAALDYALLGDRLAQLAVDNGWVGIVVHGCLRDVEILEHLPIGIMALASNPRKTVKRGEGEVDVPVALSGTEVMPGDWLYADRTGILIASKRL